MKLTLTVCNVCQDKEAPTQHFEIRGENKRAPLDLCEAHSQPLLGLMAQVPTKSTATRTRSTSRASGSVRRSRASTMEEIEAQKVGG